MEFSTKWGRQYPAITRLWKNVWSEFVPFLDYDVEIRRVICSTNASNPSTVGLEAGFGQKCINHHEEVGAMIGSLRVGNVLNGRPVIDHQK